MGVGMLGELNKVVPLFLTHLRYGIKSVSVQTGFARGATQGS